MFITITQLHILKNICLPQSLPSPKHQNAFWKICSFEYDFFKLSIFKNNSRQGILKMISQGIKVYSVSNKKSFFKSPSCQTEEIIHLQVSLKKCMKITSYLVWPSIQSHRSNILPSNLQLGTGGSLQWLLSEFSGFSYSSHGNTWNSLGSVSVGHPLYLQTHYIVAPTKTQLEWSRRNIWLFSNFMLFPTAMGLKQEAQLHCSITPFHDSKAELQGTPWQLQSK